MPHPDAPETSALAAAEAVECRRDARPTVLHFIPAIGGGGAENFLRSLVRGMAGRRWRTVIVVACVGQHTAQAEEMRSLGATLHDLNEPALLKLSLWLALRRVIASERPDVVQTWMQHADFIGGIAAWAAGCPRVVWGIRNSALHRNPGDSDLKMRLFTLALGLSSKFLPRAIIANSTVGIAVHRDMGFPAKLMTWVPNGVDTMRFHPDAVQGAVTRGELGIPAEVPVIGFVGRFHPVKDLVTFFKAAAQLQAQRPDAHFVLVGGQPEELYPEARAAYETLPQPQQVRFVPFGSATQRYYPAFTVFTLCSESEAFPNVVLEAMASAVPCVTTDAGDCRPMLADLGIVVPIRDDTALAKGWQDLLALTPQALANLGQRARQRTLDDYTMARAVERFEAVYERVAGKEVRE